MIKKLRSPFFVLLSTFLFISYAAQSQEVPRWEDFKPSLINNHVTDVVINSKGEIWLLSNSDFISLAKDKTKFTLLDSEHRFIFLEIDQNDTVWLAHAGRRQIDTGNGNDYLIMASYYNGTLKEYRKSSFPDFPHDPSSNNDDITSLYIDPTGNKWFGYNNGDVGKMDLQYQYTHYPNSFVSSDHVRDIAIDPADGSLYVTISTLLYSLSNGVWDLVTKNWPNNTFLNAVAVTNDGSVLFGGHNGLHTLKDGTFTTQDISNSNIPVDNIDDIKISGAEIFISGHDDDGYDYVFDGSFNILHRGVAHAPYPSIYSTLFINNTGPLDIWLGTNEDGLVQIGETQTLYYNNQTISLPIHNNTFVSRTTFVGELGYVATFSGLTTKRDSLFAGIHPNYSTPNIDLLSNGRTNDIAFDEKQHLYIATDSGLSVLNINTESIQNFNKQSYPALSSEWFFKTFSLGHGFTIAISNELAILFENGNISQTYTLNAGGLPWGSQWNTVLPVYSSETLSGIWIGSDVGLLFYDFTTVTNHNSDIFYSEVTALTEGPDGKLWLGFGYYGYVIQSYDKVDSWTTYYLPDIWPTWSEKQNIVGLQFDLRDTLWVLADYAVEGIWRGNSKLLTFVNETFTVIDRQFDIREWSNDLAISPTGEKWISSRDGLYIYVDDSYSGIDPCLPLVCPTGTECVSGACLTIPDGCDDVLCSAGQVCYEGSCFENCSSSNTVCADLGPNLVASAGASVTLDAGEGYHIFEWSTGETTQSILASTSGQYWVIAYDTTAQVFSSDTVNILIEANLLGECPVGFVNRDGYCFPPTDPCDGITCPEGMACFGGGCYAVCAENSCDENSFCYAGNCFVDAACEIVQCATGQTCYEGSCFENCATTNATCANLGPNLVASAGSSVTLDAGEGYHIFEWSTGETTQSILTSTSGQYWVIAYDTTAQVFSSDTVNILIEANLLGECPVGFVNRDGYCFPPTDPCDGITCPEGMTCFGGGCYAVCAENSCDENSFCYAGNCFVDAACEIVQCATGQTCYEGSCFENCATTNATCANLGPNLVASAGSSVTLDAGEGYHIFEWSTGETTQSILTSTSGQYWVIAYDTTAQVFSSDTVNILIEANLLGECPVGFVNRDGYCFPPTDPCDGITCPEGMACFGGGCYAVCAENSCDENSICYAGNCFVDAACENMQCASSQSCYEGTCFENCANSDNSVCTDLGPNLVASAGSSVTLDAGEAYHIFEWSTGETTQSILASTSGQYWVIAYDTTAQVFSSDTVNILIEANLLGECPVGFVNRDGYCFPPTDPCDGIICPEGTTCFGGGCYAVCAEESCDVNSFCYSGNCFQFPVCDDVVCDIGLICKDGQCFQGCALDTDCPEGTVCAGDVCVVTEIACDYIDCPEGNLCVYGACYPYNPFSDNLLSLSGGLFGEKIGGRTTENVPINGAVIYLFNEAYTEINGFTTTDATGHYEFKNLRPGNYKVFVEYPPYKVKGDGLITLKPDFDSTTMDIILVGEEYELILAYITGLAEQFALNKTFSLYPNPSQGKIMLSSSQDIGKVEIRISDVNGRAILQKTMNIRNAEKMLITDLKHEPAGLKVIMMYQKGQLIFKSSVLYKPE